MNARSSTQPYDYVKKSIERGLAVGQSVDLVCITLRPHRSSLWDCLGATKRFASPTAQDLVSMIFLATLSEDMSESHEETNEVPPQRLYCLKISLAISWSWSADSLIDGVIRR